MSDYIEFKMTDQQPKRARQSENVHDADQQDDNSGSPANTSEPKAITNIYYDCLERIFDFLDLESLLNVADTCKRLQIAAAAKFGDDFGGKIVHLNHNFNGREISLAYGRITVRGLKNCFAFVRCFGAKIRHLKIWHYIRGDSDDSEDRVYEYINEYCADTLVSIEFAYKNPKFWISNASKPFKNVENVAVKGYYKDDLSHFLNWFPKMRRLTLWVQCADRSAKPLSFPNLEHFEHYGDVDKNVLGLLSANPQLKSFSIIAYPNYDVATQRVLNALETNASLRNLELHPKHNCAVDEVDEDDIVQFAKQHPLLAELWISKIEADQAIMFIRHLTSLKRFQFGLKDHLEYNRLLDQLDSKWKHSLEEFQILLTC